MKILHTMHEFFPDLCWGVGRQVEEILKNSMCDHLIAAISMQSFSNFVGGSIDDRVLRTLPTPKPSFLDELLCQNRLLYKKLTATITPSDIDLIHCHDWLTWNVAWLLSRTWSKPIVFSQYSDVKERVRSGWTSMPRALLDTAIKYQQKAHEKSDLFISNKKTPLPTLDTYYLPPSSSIAPFSSRAGGLLFSVGYLGRIDLEKGVAFFVELLKSIEFDLRVVLAGDGPYRSLLIEELEKLGINYEYVGYVRNLRSFFDKIDCLLVPSLYDPGPLVLVDAISNSTPFILSDSCGLSGLLNVGKDRFVAKVNDLEDWVQKLDRMRAECAHGNLWFETFHAHLLKADFNIANYILRLENLYSDALNMNQLRS